VHSIGENDIACMDSQSESAVLMAGAKSGAKGIREVCVVYVYIVDRGSS
jgi:hypothetical protein